MYDASRLFDHWGYTGLFLAIVLGNMGLPVPEETVLALAGYAASRGVLHLPTVLVVGVVSAVVGDNIGYWLGRRYGRAAIERYGRRAFITPERLQKISEFMVRRGPRLRGRLALRRCDRAALHPARRPRHPGRSRGHDARPRSHQAPPRPAAVVARGPLRLGEALAVAVEDRRGVRPHLLHPVVDGDLLRRAAPGGTPARARW